MVKFDFTGPPHILIFVLLGAPAARADFRLSQAAEVVPISDIPHVSPGDFLQRRVLSVLERPIHSIISVIARARAAQRQPSDELVQGFGAAVLLAFACRQILPKTVHVVYAPTVDPLTPVNWTGGRPWAAVLRDALRPAGLTLVPHGNLVEVRK